MKKFALVFVVLVAGGIGLWVLRRPAPVPSATAEKTPAVVSTPVAAQPAVDIAAPRVATPPAKPAPAAAAPEPGPKKKMELRDVLLPGNRIHDEKMGMSATFPAHWTARTAALRWGVNEGENTIFYGVPDSRATSSMYYRKYTDGPAFDQSNPEATLRDMARQKEVSRIADGRTDYRNDPDSFVLRSINGNPSLSYFATYTNPGTREVHAEYFVRILSPTGYVMFFNYGPVNDVKAIIPTVVDMAGTVKPP